VVEEKIPFEYLVLATNKVVVGTVCGARRRRRSR